MPSNKCSVLGCNSSSNVKKHVFPLDDDDFKMWILRTGNEKLVNLSKPYIRKTYLVCTEHFSCTSYSPGTSRLKKHSLPSLNLPTILPSVCPVNKSTDITMDESMNLINDSCSSPLALPLLNVSQGKN
ncbi:uncharacterized protein LOC112592279 [Melanaphis sacchari]|uniref:uncharacterized protein LOC112592279 n=1 Tax=Melanaphis sacchari TaxID=742174 RepID=UPI000DC13B6E|nr:uncharacterized protein LOC112592279 [Melanaphis sacchari]